MSMNEQLDGPRAPLPIIQRLELGKLAVVTGVLETAGAVASVASHESAYVIGATFFNAVLAGGSVYDAHEHHVNGYTRKSGFVRERQWSTNQG